MASSNNTGGGSVGSASAAVTQPLCVQPSSSSNATGQQEIWTHSHQEVVENLCDEALAMLLSMAGTDRDDSEESTNANQEIVTTCIATTSKMLDNIKRNPKEAKFRSIRVQNGNFNAKVYRVPGGKELFTAAGFQLHTVVSTSGEEESYLKHDMSYIKTKMLVYVLGRLKSLELD